MRRSFGLLVGGLGMAGAAAVLLSNGHLAAQTPSAGAPQKIESAPKVAMAQDETAPRMFSSPWGDIFRLWQREGDPRTGGGAVLLAVARPQDAWSTVLEIQPSEQGVTARDGDLAFGSSRDLALVYRWWRTTPRSKELRVAYSTDDGKTWNQPTTQVDRAGTAFEPRIATTLGKGLVVAWSDERRGNRIFDVYARRSPDGGTTWEPEQILSQFPTNSPTNYYNQPKLLTDGQNRLWAAWIGFRGGKSRIFLNRSVDAGRTWTGPMPLTGESESVFGHTLVRAGDHMLLVWQDRIGEVPDRIYAVTSSDAGLTWTAPMRVDHLPDGPLVATAATALLSPDGEALVAWQDNRNGREDIFLGRSTDEGRTWGKEDQRMDQDDPGTAISRFPKLAKAPDGRVAIAWEDDRAGYESIYLRVRSAGQKPQWGPEVLVTPSGRKLAQRIPELTWGPEGVYLTWQVWDYSLEPRVDKRIASRVVRAGGAAEK
jgi:hypothetical protein